MKFLWNWLRNNSGELQSLGAILAIFLFVVTIWQINDTRNVLRVQTIAASLSDGRAILSDLADSPETAAKMFLVPESMVKEVIFVQNTLSLFSQQHLFWESGMVSESHWNKIKRDICEFASISEIKPIVTNLIDRRVYLDEFSEILQDCGKEKS